MGCRFVQPHIVRLPLSHGDWIDVKLDLNVGEQRAMFADMRRRFAPGELPTLDPAQVSVARMLAYLVGWSFIDRTGTPVAVSPGAVDALHPDDFQEMSAALDGHIEGRERDLAAEKKTSRAGVSVSDPTLQSVS